MLHALSCSFTYSQALPLELEEEKLRAEVDGSTRGGRPDGPVTVGLGWILVREARTIEVSATCHQVLPAVVCHREEQREEGSRETGSEMEDLKNFVTPAPSLMSFKRPAIEGISPLSYLSSCLSLVTTVRLFVLEVEAG